ncbi:MAG: hypothetical protein JWP63_2552 [Candidatus Solibacter sp.]|nr:hypothetical protein [Candidatus Solibacter sp.]
MHIFASCEHGPTQINFLVPSDALATATTISVSNPAGTFAPLPLAVQAQYSARTPRRADREIRACRAW